MDFATIFGALSTAADHNDKMQKYARIHRTILSDIQPLCRELSLTKQLEMALEFFTNFVRAGALAGPGEKDYHIMKYYEMVLRANDHDFDCNVIARNLYILHHIQTAREKGISPAVCKKCILDVFATFTLLGPSLGATKEKKQAVDDEVE